MFNSINIIFSRIMTSLICFNKRKTIKSFAMPQGEFLWRLSQNLADQNQPIQRFFNFRFEKEGVDQLSGFPNSIFFANIQIIGCLTNPQESTTQK